MKNLFRILLLISISYILLLSVAVMVLRLRESLFSSHFLIADVLGLTGVLILGVGCFMFQVKNMKIQNIEAGGNMNETALDDHLVKNWRSTRPFSLLLQASNILFGAGAGVGFAILQEMHFSTFGRRSDVFVGVLIWACLYVFAYIILGGFFSYVVKNR